jgi:hypothetical protein
MTQELVVEGKPQLVKLTDIAIETITRNIKQAERMVTGVLERDIDYGRLPGTPQPGLWDPGASKILNAFNTYPDYRVLHHVEEDNLISYTIQSVLISRDNQMVVGTGIGACSTREAKYKYRWVPDPANYGYSEEEIKTLKLKDGKYRIANPEYGELVNTVAKMAAKRADVDAAQSLPGVGSALRKLFTGKTAVGGNAEKESSPNWSSFWSQVSALGLSENDVHYELGVDSMMQWLANGKTLNQAIEVLSQNLASRRQPAPSEVKSPHDPTVIKTFGDLYTACREDLGMSRQQVWGELGVNSQAEIAETPAECYKRITAVR